MADNLWDVSSKDKADPEHMGKRDALKDLKNTNEFIETL